MSGRPVGAAGTCVTCVLEGSRPILAEIQALITKTSANIARRNFNGLNFNRSMLLLAGILQLVKLPILRLMGLSGESLSIGSSLLLIFGVVAVIRLMNWVQNDTYRSAGDSVTGTVMEIVFTYVLVLPLLLLNYKVFRTPLLILFICVYIDEPIRFILMQIHMYSGRWIRPVTPEGQATLPAFREKYQIRVREKKA